MRAVIQHEHRDNIGAILRGVGGAAAGPDGGFGFSGELACRDLQSSTFLIFIRLHCGSWGRPVAAIVAMCCHHRSACPPFYSPCSPVMRSVCVSSVLVGLFMGGRRIVTAGQRSPSGGHMPIPVSVKRD